MNIEADWLQVGETWLHLPHPEFVYNWQLFTLYCDSWWEHGVVAVSSLQFCSLQYVHRDGGLRTYQCHHIKWQLLYCSDLWEGYLSTTCCSWRRIDLNCTQRMFFPLRNKTTICIWNTPPYEILNQSPQQPNNVLLTIFNHADTFELFSPGINAWSKVKNKNVRSCNIHFLQHNPFIWTCTLETPTRTHIQMQRALKSPSPPLELMSGIWQQRTRWGHSELELDPCGRALLMNM